MVFNRLWFLREPRGRINRICLFNSKRVVAEREVSKILRILEFVTDAKLNYDTTKVWKRMWKMEYFDLKLGQDLGNRAAHPYQELQGVPPSRILVPYPWSSLPLLHCLLDDHQTKDGRTVLLSSTLGISRNVSVAIAYYMWNKKVSLKVSAVIQAIKEPYLFTSYNLHLEPGYKNFEAVEYAKIVYWLSIGCF